MNNETKLKVKHKVEDLIAFIERNEYTNAKKIIECKKRLLKHKKMDDFEPIYYAIKYKCNKIFRLILDNSNDISYDVSISQNIIF